MATSISVREFGVAGADAPRLSLAGFSVSGLDITQLQLIDFSVGGITPGLTASNTQPDSGEPVVLVYGGAISTVVWRQISGPATTLTPAGTTCNADMPILTAAAKVVIGAKDGTQTERTVELSVAPATEYYFQTAAVMLPVAEYVLT